MRFLHKLGSVGLVAGVCLACALLFCGTVAAAERARPVFSCAADNDLYRVLAECGVKCARHDSPTAAVAAAPEGAGVLLLADGYPAQTQQLSPEIFATATRKRLRLYVEYPAAVPGLEVGAARGTKYERGVVVSQAFAPKLGPMRIVAVHDCHFVPVAAEKPHLVIAKVAGLDTAVFGLPQSDVWPLLFEHPSRKILVSTTKLSQFVTARYAPIDAWKAVWPMILGWVQPGIALPELEWTPVVRPSYGPDDPLPADAELRAIRRATEWLLKARMLVHPSWLDKDWGIDPRLTYERGTAAKADQRFRLPDGDGSEGLLEGFKSTIRCDGSQEVRWWRRSDCVGEEIAAMVLAGKVLGEPKYTQIGKNLADYLWFRSAMVQGNVADPAHPAYGLLGWYDIPGNPQGPDRRGWSYGVINTRAACSTLAAAAVLRCDAWDEPIMRCLLANLRTTGLLGFRDCSVSDTRLAKTGWERHFLSRSVSYSSHCHAQLWAGYLLAYRHTGCGLFLQRAKTAIGMMMKVYPEWLWYNGLQQERGRMLLPLAWLVRVEDTPEHRAWLKRIAEDYLADQAPCGAVRDVMGAPGQGVFPAPRSNAAYGSNEASLIQTNGEPVCDLLYTLNSGFWGLHEAAAATRDPLYRQAEDRLAKFLCRIQVRSEKHPEFDGAWFRAFEFDRWEYWASNSDQDWGAWCTENGWIQGWLVTVMALRQMNTSLWDLTRDSTLGRYCDKYRRTMLPDEILQRANAK